ncbi:S1C family serine protease [Rhodococcus aerolatus]
MLAAAALAACGYGGGLVVLRDRAAADTPLAVGPVLTGPTRFEPEPALDLPELAARVAPGVVRVDAVAGRSSGQGSGVVLSADGLVVTTDHVVAAGVTAGSQGLRVSFPDGTSSTATLVGRAPEADLAVVKTDDGAPRTPVPLGSSATLAVGQDVVAVGSPLGLAGTTSEGIVSALARAVRTDVTGRGRLTVLDAVQTDAAVNPGSSGGALVNRAGQLVGLTVVPPADPEAAAAGQAPAPPTGYAGVSYAIPVDQLTRLANELVQAGTATQAVLGLGLAPPGPNGFGTPGGGATVASVVPGGPADRAGLAAGDVVTRLGERVVRDGDSLAAALRAAAPGQEVDVALARPERTVRVTLGSRPA